MSTFSGYAEAEVLINESATGISSSAQSLLYHQPDIIPVTSFLFSSDIYLHILYYIDIDLDLDVQR